MALSCLYTLTASWCQSDIVNFFLRVRHVESQVPLLQLPLASIKSFQFSIAANQRTKSCILLHSCQSFCLSYNWRVLLLTGVLPIGMAIRRLPGQRNGTLYNGPIHTI